MMSHRMKAGSLRKVDADASFIHPAERTVEGQLLVTNSIYAQFCCLFCAAPCHCCCGCFPPVKESTTTRLMYLMMFIFTIIMSVFSLIPEIPAQIIQASSFLNSTCYKYSIAEGYDCTEFFGKFTAVYKMCSGQLLMHVLLIPITLCSSNSTTFSGSLHNGYWFWKWALIITVDVVLLLYVHEEHFAPIAIMLRILGLVGGFLYITVNIFFMCQVTIEVNSKLFRKADVDKKWYIGIWIITVVMLTISVLVCYIIYAFYSGCMVNRLIIIAHTLGCFVIIVITAIPSIYKGNPNGDLLQSSVVVSYIMYGTWSALHSRPNEDFNVTILSNVISSGIQLTSNMTTAFGSNNLTSPSVEPEFQCITINKEIHSRVAQLGVGFQYAGLIYYLFVAIYKSFQQISIDGESKQQPAYYDSASSYYSTRRPLRQRSQQVTRVYSSVYQGKLMTPAPRSRCCDGYFDCKPDITNAGQKVKYNEKYQTTYRYWFLHFQFTCSILFIMMELTRWFDPGSVVEWKPNWAAFWIDILSVWLIFVLYFATWLKPTKKDEANKYLQTYMNCTGRQPATRAVPEQYYTRLGIRIGNPKAYKKDELYVYDENGKLIPVKQFEEAATGNGAKLLFETATDFLCCQS